MTSLARSSKVALPSLIAVAEAQAEPLEKEVRRRRAEDAVPLAKQVVARQGGLGLQRAEQRIGAVDRLDLGQRLVGAVLEPRHGAHGGADRDRAEAVEPGPLGGGRLALVELEADVAAEQRLALVGDAGGDRAAPPN